MTVTAGSKLGNAAWWWLTLVLCAAMLAPLTLVDVPPLLDYPNHLARLYALAFADDPVIARFYQPHWAIIPNLALDLTVPPLLRIFPVHVIGRVVIGLIVLLPVLGAIAYHRALTGRLSYWPLGAVLFAWNGASLRGFLNFIASVGLALLLGAAWVSWRERRPSLAVVAGVVGAVAVFFCHLTGLVFFAILIGGHELDWLRRERRDFRAITRRIAIVFVVFAVSALLYGMSDLRDMQGEVVFRTATDKANATLMPVLNYFWPLDLTAAVLSVVIPAFCLARRWCAMPFQAAVALLVSVMLFLVLPTAFKATFDLDTRFIIMAAVLLPAALVPVALPPRAARAIGLGFLLLFTVRMGVMLWVWHDWASYLTAFRGVIASVRPGDVVMSVRLPRGEDHDPWTGIATARRLSDATVVDSHIPALLLIEHHAWWPFMFDNPSQQPIESRPPFREMSVKIDTSPDPIGLLSSDPEAMRPITHVLVRGPAPGPGDIKTPGLRLLKADGEAALYAVDRAEVRPPPGPPPGR